MSRPALAQDLSRLLDAGDAGVLDGDTREYLHDATESRGLRGRADAIVLPSSPAEVAAVVAWCYARDVAIVPRGGGTGFAGGAVPDGGVVVALDRVAQLRTLDAAWWRMHVDAGMRTADVRRHARESGLRFPPDPGAAEQSQIGGNIATNAGGPHAFKYGVTGAWVTGLEAVVAPGEVVAVGGPVRKDVAGYDLKSLLIGSEGTLGIVTGAWLRLVPAPEAALPVVAFYGDTADGCAGIGALFAAGLQVAAIEFLDAAALAAAERSFPADVPAGARFMVVAEADGSAAEAVRVRDEAVAVLGGDALGVVAPDAQGDVAALWRWRDGVSLAVESRRGGKLSEDVVVPVDRLAEAIEGTLVIGSRHGLDACSWGHAGDGNLHATFLLDPADAGEVARAEAAADELFALALALGGSISGEHGTGVAKAGALSRQWAPAAVALHDAVKRAFDPKGLFNPGKKRP